MQIVCNVIDASTIQRNYGRFQVDIGYETLTYFAGLILEM